ncbi:hypothetical protein BYT27DRAFT_7122341 [Phlegmacium glaucopus]|nr:hypothetical protein BYT27DRAFT_7122341 [Phlegmacium glaucopus]
MPIIEFVSCRATDEYLEDFHTRVKPTLDYVQNADGCTSVYFGLEEEDPTTIWMVFVWKTIEHHQVMMKRPDYPDMVAALQPFLRDGQMNMCHVEFNNDIAVAFTAPTTAISTLTLTENQNRADLDVLLKTLGEALDHGHGGHAPIAWGETQEEPGKFLLVVGWDSVQVNCVATSRVLQNLKFICRNSVTSGWHLWRSYPRV